MSYGPPTKTAYGDQDFIKEDYAPQPPSFAPPSPPPSPEITGNLQASKINPYGQPSPYGQLPVGQQSNNAGYFPPNREAVLTTNPIVAATQTMTQEDILFMKSWRQDTFYRRVLPLATIVNGAYFYYNHTKGLPHKPLRYILVTGACYFVGVWSFRGELRRRIIENSSNTPFMLAMKRLTGVQGQTSEFQDVTAMHQEPSGGWSTTGDGFSRRPYPPPLAPSTYPNSSISATSPYDQSSFGQYNQPESSGYGSYDSGLAASSNSSRQGTENSDLASKPVTSYEDLRARNRGLLPPKQM